MRRVILLSALGLAVLLSSVSCVGATRYVVLDKVPESPSATVIPASMSRADMAAANRVTGLLIACGMYVVERPVMMKERSEYRGEGSAGGVAVGAGGLALTRG